VAKVFKSVDDRFAVRWTERYCEGWTLLFTAVHPIFFVALERLADQVCS